MSRPLRVAVVGAGPAGLYAAGHLLEGPGGTYLDGSLQQLVTRPVEVDVFDRVPTQWGLVRHGVAPDHPDKKLVQRVFEETAARSGFRFFGNVEVGNQIHPAELSDWYDAVVYAVGASGDAALGIPGENLRGSISARAFVAWYNGHPDAVDLAPDLSQPRAVVVGNGNVALDVARILTLPVAALTRTDIAPHALEALAASRIREVIVLGRRAHVHAAFNNAELEELGRLPDVDILIEYGNIPAAADFVDDDLDESTRRKVATIQRYADRPLAGHERRIVLRFGSSPQEILGEGSVTAVRLTSGAEQIVLEAGLLLRSIGYFGTPLPGLPFDELLGVVPNVAGRVEGKPGVYVTGWAKRGPRGIIGTNKKCARDTVISLLADANQLQPGTLTAEEVEAVVRERQPTYVDQAGWLRLDDTERRAGRELGKTHGRPRVKLVTRAALVGSAGNVR